MEIVAFPSQFSDISLMVELSCHAQEITLSIFCLKDRFRVVLVINGLALGHLLVKQAQIHHGNGSRPPASSSEGTCPVLAASSHSTRT